MSVYLVPNVDSLPAVSRMFDDDAEKLKLKVASQTAQGMQLRRDKCHEPMSWRWRRSSSH